LTGRHTPLNATRCEAQKPSKKTTTRPKAINMPPKFSRFIFDMVPVDRPQQQRGLEGSRLSWVFHFQLWAKQWFVIPDQVSSSRFVAYIQTS
jgi:hypothetical protein